MSLKSTNPTLSLVRKIKSISKLIIKAVWYDFLWILDLSSKFLINTLKEICFNFSTMQQNVQCLNPNSCFFFCMKFTCFPPAYMDSLWAIVLSLGVIVCTSCVSGENSLTSGCRMLENESETDGLTYFLIKLANSLSDHLGELTRALKLNSQMVGWS